MKGISKPNNVDIDSDEYKRRQSLTSNSSSSSTLHTTNNTMSNSSIHQQFGLELYETNSLSDIRDPSIEKMIKLNRRNSTNFVENEDDTTIPTEEDNTSNSSTTIDDDSDLSILADLLGKNSGHRNNGNKDIVDLKRQLLYNQLEMVQRQKDQLEQQSKKVAASSLATPIVAPSTVVNRPTRLVNMHELSTIKEVDTPISERNLKINTNVANNTTSTTNNNTNTNYSQWFATSRNKSSTNLTEVSSLATSSLENVTRLDESKVANRTANSRLSPNLPSPKNYDLHDDIPVSNNSKYSYCEINK